MLDVHPTHSTTHTWRDFFIHIATIAVGLLIALCLEQTVEALHRHHERVHLIDDLRQEARGRVLEIQENNRSYLALENWLQDTLHASLSATTAAGLVVFTLPHQSLPLLETHGRQRRSGLQLNPPESLAYLPVRRLRIGSESTTSRNSRNVTPKAHKLPSGLWKLFVLILVPPSLRARLSGLRRQVAMSSRFRSDW